MSGETRSVAVVIPSWNSAGLLPRCLLSLADQGVELEPLVVDNGSTDGSLEYLEREQVPHISLPRNIGFAAAVNLGVRRAAADSVLVLNVDTALEPGCVRRLSDVLVSDPTLGGVQPRILQLSGERAALGEARLYSVGQALTRDGRAFEMGAGEPQRPEHAAPAEIFGVCGAAALLRRGLFDELGGYDERYFAFYEDVDLNVRARIAGWRFAYVPEAVVWHVGNASWQQEFRDPGAQNAWLVARNRLATQAKYLSPASLPLLAAVEAGALGKAASRRRFRATLRGKLAAFRWAGSLLRERRRLAADGDPELARRWLGRDRA